MFQAMLENKSPAPKLKLNKRTGMQGSGISQGPVTFRVTVIQELLQNTAIRLIATGGRPHQNSQYTTPPSDDIFWNMQLSAYFLIKSYPRLKFPEMLHVSTEKIMMINTPFSHHWRPACRNVSGHLKHLPDSTAAVLNSTSCGPLCLQTFASTMRYTTWFH